MSNRSPFRRTFIATASVLAISTAQSVQAQQEEYEEAVDVIEVQGIRGSIRESLDVKRETSVVSDALIGVEIGDLPDLSIAESLERITGVTSDRFKGGASSISVRGLGDYLGFATLNGREVSSGSDGRGVNFGQFPSELFEGLVVYKTQQASFVEGGVSGIISLQTLRPLDYNRRRLQINGLLGYSEYEDRVDGGDPFNQRLTLSYVDQFETGGLGEIGIAIGGQIRRDTAPEEVYTTSSSWRPCNTIEGVDGNNDCSYETDADGNPIGASPTYFVSNQYIYRAMKTQADRDAVMANVQWRPSEKWNINADFQYSDREDIEERHNLVVADGRRDIDPVSISPGTGALEAWTGETRIENQSVYRPRLEEYIGGGVGIEWTPTDVLSLSADFGYSKTERRQDERDMRIRTNDRVTFELDTRDTLIPNLTILDVEDVEDDTGLAFNLDDHDLYDNGARARRRRENIDDEVISLRFDADYALNGVFFSSMEAGVRISKRERLHDDGIDDEVDLVDDDYFSPGAIDARRDEFIVEDLFEGTDTAMEGITWATWDPYDLFVALTGSPDAGLIDTPDLSPDDTDVTEKTFSAYIQGNIETMMGDTPVTGNVGLRVVQTDIESVGISSALVTEAGEEEGELLLRPVGDPTLNTETNDFTTLLPSANLTFAVTDDQLLRLAGYRAMARPSMEDMSAALAFSEDGFGPGEIGNQISASGNPDLRPLTSWNADLSYEWYATEDTAISAALYYKYLETGLTADFSDVTVIVNGQPLTTTIGRLANSDDASDLLGAELTVQHVFTNLPAPLDGFGIRGGINWADTDFEYPDPSSQDGNALADFTKPLSIPGYSRFSGNLTVFWENEDVSVRLAYKGRSGYNKPFRFDANRWTGGQEFLDFSASYDVTDSVELRFQALNILDEPNVFYRPVKDSLAQTDLSGRRFFVGARARF